MVLAVMLTASASANNYEKGKEAYLAGDPAAAPCLLNPRPRRHPEGGVAWGI